MPVYRTAGRKGRFMRAAAYIRVSTQEQAKEGYSIGAQTKRLKAYCAARDWTLAGIYTDPGFSGAKLDRPALQRMLSDIQKGEIDIVVVFKLDRLSRSQKDTLYLIEDVFLKNSVAFVSINENFDTSTAFGRAMVGILSVFAQLEREQIRERTMMGLQERAKDGYWRGGGNAPIGYVYDRQQGILVIDDYEAMQIRKIFDLYVNGHLSVTKTAKVMSSTYKNHYGSWKSRANIMAVLSNQTYLGKIPYNGEYFDGRHEPIIDQKTFAEAQRLLQLRSAGRKPDGPHHSPFRATQLLTGLLWCGGCGARFYAAGSYRGSKKLPCSERQLIHHYMCYSRAKTRPDMVKDPDCKNEKWRVETLDQCIADEILGLEYDSGHLRAIREDAQAGKAVDGPAVTQKRIGLIEQQIGKLLDLYQLQDIPSGEVSGRIRALTLEKERLLQSLPEEDAPGGLDDEKTAVPPGGADAILKSDTLENRRYFVHTLIKRVVLNGNTVEIEWNF